MKPKIAILIMKPQQHSVHACSCSGITEQYIDVKFHMTHIFQERWCFDTSICNYHVAICYRQVYMVLNCCLHHILKESSGQVSREMDMSLTTTSKPWKVRSKESLDVLGHVIGKIPNFHIIILER